MSHRLSTTSSIGFLFENVTSTKQNSTVLIFNTIHFGIVVAKLLILCYIQTVSKLLCVILLNFVTVLYTAGHCFSVCFAMTTAHRATFVPAHGGTGKNEGDLSKLSKQYSSRDMPSHTKIKYRQHSQGHADELRNRDFRRELEDRERNTGSKRRPENNYDDPSSYSHDKKVRYEKVSYRNPDDDDPSICEEDDDSNDSDEDDETAQLMAELERIKKEREAERKEEEAKRKAEEERVRVENILRGNPLLTSNKQDFRVQRRWDDDVVFKNCAKGIDEKRKNQPAFINDALRSEFHRKFMEKYIK
ncbi:Protein CWC15 -like protein A [Trichinella spiralis]|uniref:Protein CWC15-like protein A n=2 Tax=Trichinella spiralis TaxID=6334 RepID=A0A0V1BQU4_TRISP|nr:Protein CWC15 -like protein A [Trichinella spiralis]